jgi:putative transposase
LTSPKELNEAKIQVKSDERILGDGNFVFEMLSLTEESLERRYALKSKGVNISFIAQRISKLLGISADDVWREGKNKRLVKARSLLCFWAVRELGITMTSMARELNLSIVAVSKSVERGAEIIKREGLELFP